MEETRYQKTQFGTVVVVATIVAAAVAGGLMANGALNVAAGACAVLVLIACGVVFSSLTVRITTTAIEWWLTFHLFAQRVALADIDIVSTKRLGLLYGYGFRTNGRDTGWIVSGRDAVELLLRNGKRIAIGTADSAAVLAAIGFAIG